MFDSFLQTKLRIPISPDVHVERPHIRARLRMAQGCRLILVSAPAGFGKTMIVSDWLRAERLPAAWFSIDSGDNDPYRFAAYLLKSLNGAVPGLCSDELEALSVGPPPVEAILVSLVNSLTNLSQRLVIVLDDYHRIDHQEIHSALEFLLEYLPDNVSICLVTRIDPPLPLARLRARASLVEIRAADLRFSPEETGEFLDKVMGLRLSPGQVRMLDARTEGWAAGLQMAGLSMQTSRDLDGFLEAFSGSNRFILDYLTEEVLQHLPDSLRSFLFQTAILGRLSAGLCDEVTGGTDARSMLRKLETANLFLVPLDQERRWYRYHQLFADLLVRRLHQDEPQSIPELNSRAAAWYEINGFPDEAIAHACEAGDLPAVERIIALHGFDYLRQGRTAEILAWAARVPVQLAGSNPQVALTFAWANLLAGQTDAAERYLEQLDNAADPSVSSSGDLSAVRAYAASLHGDLATASAEAQRSLEELPVENVTVRAVMSFVLGGIAFMQADLTEAIRHMRDAARLGEASGNLNSAVAALNALANLQLQAGDRRAAAETFENGLRLSTGESGRPLPIAAGIYSGLARLRLAENDLPAARRAAETAVRLGEKWRNPDSRLYAHLSLARIARREGEINEARIQLAAARTIANTHTLTPNVDGDIREVEAFLIDPGRQQGLAEPLSVRELEVLRLIAAGMPNRRIAEELVIAIGTVKAHTASIYGKLAVNSRMQAVARARELHLL